MAGASGSNGWQDNAWDSSWHDSEWNDNDRGRSWNEDNSQQWLEERNWETPDPMEVVGMMRVMQDRIDELVQTVRLLEQRIHVLEQSRQQRGDEQARGPGDVRDGYRVCRNVAMCGLEFRVNPHHPDEQYCCSRCRRAVPGGESSDVHSAHCQTGRSRRVTRVTEAPLPPKLEGQSM